MVRIVYKLTNLVENKIYIGLTRFTVQERFQMHLLNAKTKKTKWNRLYAALRTYGAECWKLEVLSQHNRAKDACTAEIEAIAQFKCCNPSIGYNCRKGGQLGDGWNRRVLKQKFEHDSSSESYSDAGAKWISSVLDPSEVNQFYRWNGVQRIKDEYLESEHHLEAITGTNHESWYKWDAPSANQAGIAKYF